MKIGHWKQAHSYLTRPDTRTPEQKKIMEELSELNGDSKPTFVRVELD